MAHTNWQEYSTTYDVVIRILGRMNFSATYGFQMTKKLNESSYDMQDNFCLTSHYTL